MIVFAEKKHMKDIVSLWNEAFGDEPEEIMSYLNFLLRYCAVYTENGSVSGMLFLIPISCGGKKGRYVYAVATRKNRRGNGISTSLLDFAKRFIYENGEEFLVLVPQNEKLFEFYEKRGFEPFSCVEKRTVRTLGRDFGMTVERISCEEYFAKRREFLHGKKLLEWSCEVLKFAEKMYSGEFTAVLERGKCIGIAFVSKATAEIKEIAAADTDNAAAAVGRYFSQDEITCVCPESEGSPFAMMYPRAAENAYFNIALD